MSHYADRYMKRNNPKQETQRADGVGTIIFTKLTSITWRNIFNIRNFLDFGYAFQSTDGQLSDIREPSDFRLQHWVFSLGRNKSLNIAPHVSSQFPNETINDYSRDVRYSNAVIYKMSLVEYEASNTKIYVYCIYFSR